MTLHYTTRHSRRRAHEDKSASLVFQLKALNFATRYTMETQFRFHHTRRWTFDVAFPHLRLAIEVDGGLYLPGGAGHTRGKAREDDMEKDAEAMILGWRVLRVSPTHVRTGIAVQWIDRILTEHL